MLVDQESICGRIKSISSFIPDGGCIGPRAEVLSQFHWDGERQHLAVVRIQKISNRANTPGELADNDFSLKKLRNK